MGSIPITRSKAYKDTLRTLKVVSGDLNSRRGKIHNMTARLSTQVISAEVPLAQMFGYATDLRSMTQGRANYSMEFSHYSAVPSNIAQEVIARAHR